MLREPIFDFVKIILHLSLSCIVHLTSEKKLVLEFLTFLVFCNAVILEGDILNICEEKFSKLKSLHDQACIFGFSLAKFQLY